MMWYSDKAAFRAGELTLGSANNWDKDSIGFWSFAWGLNTKASGSRSTAWGHRSEASGNLSTAWGWNTEALGSNSTAWGQTTKASGSMSTAWGDQSEASGSLSTAWGMNTEASGYRATAWGMNTEASGNLSTTWGQNTEASGSLATAWGWNTEASGSQSTAWGLNTEASGNQSTAWGGNTEASGTNSTAWGNNTIAFSGYETVLGRYNTQYTPSSSSGWNSNDRLFVIGNGTSENNRSDALVLLKNGNLGLGTSDPRGRFNVSLNSGVTDASVINEYPVVITYPSNANNQETGIAFIISTGSVTPGAAITHQRTGVGSLGHLLFKTKGEPGEGPVLERMRITSGGKMGIGITNPSDQLEVAAPENEDALRVRTGNTTRLRVYASGGVGIGSNMQGSPPPAGTLSVSSRLAINVSSNDAGSFRLAVNGDAAKPGGGSWSVFSDARLKESVQQLKPGILDHLLQLKGYTFHYKPEAIENHLALPGTQTGLIAQEVQEVFPDWVEADEEGYLFVTERGLTAIIVEALRELREEKDAEIAQLRKEKDAEIAELRDEKDNQIVALQNRLENMEALLQSVVEQVNGSGQLKVENVTTEP